jgi:hypothetical protein
MIRFQKSKKTVSANIPTAISMAKTRKPAVFSCPKI